MVSGKQGEWYCLQMLRKIGICLVSICLLNLLNDLTVDIHSNGIGQCQLACFKVVMGTVFGG